LQKIADLQFLLLLFLLVVPKNAKTSEALFCETLQDHEVSLGEVDSKLGRI